MSSAQPRSNDGLAGAVSSSRAEQHGKEALQSLDALTRSALPSMLLMLLMRAGERDDTEPLGHAVGRLGALQGHLARRGDTGALASETRQLGRDAVGALFSAVTTLRQQTE